MWRERRGRCEREAGRGRGGGEGGTDGGRGEEGADVRGRRDRYEREEGERKEEERGGKNRWREGGARIKGREKNGQATRENLKKGCNNLRRETNIMVQLLNITITTS